MPVRAAIETGVLRATWHRDVDVLEDEWEDLAERLGASPFAYPGWFGAWYGAFGRGEPLVLAIRRGERLVAVLPLERRGRVLGAAANWHTPLYGLLAEPDAVAEAGRRLLACPARRRDLTMLDPSDPLLAVLRSKLHIERVVTHQPWVDTTGSWDEFQANLARKKRKEMGRQRRRLEEHGQVRAEFASGGERLEDLLDEGFAIEGSGWKSQRGSAIVSNPAAHRFYRDVARWADAHGWLRLAFLRVGGRAVAFDMHLEADGAVCVLKGGFDPAWAPFSAGTLLTRESLERAFADPSLRSYEFLGSADAYKLDWTDATRERVRMQTFASTPAGAASWAAWKYGRRLAKRALAAVRR